MYPLGHVRNIDFYPIEHLANCLIDRNYYSERGNENTFRRSNAGGESSIARGTRNRSLDRFFVASITLLTSRLRESVARNAARYEY